MNNPAYDACIKAADHIEAHPDEYRFQSVDVPPAKHCGTPGCALGWISFFSGFARPVDASGFLADYDVALKPVLGFGGVEDFYNAMDKLSEHWRDNGKKCAEALRIFAVQNYA